MEIKSNIPKILLPIGNILIFTSLFFVWFSYLSWSGEREDFYGYERNLVITILILSVVPTAYYMIKNKIGWIIVWIPFLELAIYYIEKSVEELVTEATVEEGFGWTFALFGIILQIIGVIIGILLKQKRSKVDAPPTDRSEHKG